MESLLVVTGPPGAGKSALATGIAMTLSPSVLVEGDTFFRFLRAGAIEPWLAEADDQNTIVTSAAAAAAGSFAKGGLETVYDGVIRPRDLDKFLRSTGLASLDYVVLLPPATVCIERVLTRLNHGFKDEAAARQMHDQFTSQRPPERHLVHPAGESVDQLTKYVLDARSRGRLTYPGV